MKKWIRFISLFTICSLLFPIFFSKAEPKTKITTNTWVLDFKRCTKDMIPTLNFSVTSLIKEEIQFTFKPSVNWIHLSTYSIISKEAFIKVDIDPSSLKIGQYKEKIEIASSYGNISLPIWFELVEKTVKMKVVIDNPVVEIQDIPQEPLEAAPYIMGGRSWLPVRVICEAIGAKIEWVPRPYNQEYEVQGGGYIKISLPPQEIEVQIHNKYVFINNHLYQDVYHFVIRCGRAFTTMDFFETAFGVSFYFFPEERAYLIEY